jgi:FKBP-type peptidyl-prolyl cis-trans isomerase SlyD
MYIHGIPGIIPGLEKALEGREVGEEFKAVIPPEEAYGSYSEELVTQANKSQFQDPDQVKVGAQFQVRSGEQVHVATVTEIEGETITMDLNHPLADQTLHFDVKIESIREATEEELEHGHVHGEGGHQH